MANTATLYRFRIALSDVDRGVYEQLDFRVAKHPSESDLYLLTRVLAYVLNYEPGLNFSPGGLSDPDGPAILKEEPNVGIALWIEIGNPSAKKLHRASKASATVKVYTYKDPQIVLQEALENKVHRIEEIEIVPLAPSFLERLAQDLPREVKWNVLHHDGLLTVSYGDKSEQMAVERAGLR